MAIMTPLAIQLGYAITGDITFSTGMTGAVVSGAIFGDHCSPVSDTTVMASIFSGADHIEHVGTQVPYAVTRDLCDRSPVRDLRLHKGFTVRADPDRYRCPVLLTDRSS